MNGFYFHVRCDTEQDEICLPIAYAEEPLSDEVLKRYIRTCVKLWDIPYSADEIMHLSFLAGDTVGDIVLEPLNPFAFWPRRPSVYGAENISKYRVAKGGGE